MTISELLSEWIRDAFRSSFPDVELDLQTLRAVPSSNPDFGDYQCNDAMSLARLLKKSPRDIATAVAKHTPLHAGLERVEVAGPGFINLYIKNEWLARHLEEMFLDSRLGTPMAGKGKTVVIDYSSPNVAKPMHIGHIRSTIIGNAIDRLHRFLGYQVISDNHIGDWGTQFGILIMGYRHFLDAKALAQSPVEELERIYVKSYEQTRSDETWLTRCRQELLKLQQGDEENRTLWKQFVELSMGEFARVYARLDVKLDMVRGESYYNDRLAEVVQRLEKNGTARLSEGALVAFLEDEKLPPCIIRKSDGAFNYAATDIATVESRVKEFKPDKIVYVTDERQQLHFRQVFSICRKLGYTTPLDHVWFGLMRLPEGTFSTREGNVIKLERLLDEAETRALAMVRESSPEMEEEQQREVARAVGIAAVKYADLSQNPQSLITFTWEKALALEGNSAPYLQYAYARISSVLDKYKALYPAADLSAHPISLAEPMERKLAEKLTRFPETVLAAAHSYKPNVLADYLYDISQAYSSFYQNLPFLKAPEGVRESRIRLCGMAARILKTGLALLGIETPERI